MNDKGKGVGTKAKHFRGRKIFWVMAKGNFVLIKPDFQIRFDVRRAMSAAME